LIAYLGFVLDVISIVVFRDKAAQFSVTL